jgi:EmrB/QacA subfamily drug resistance transporter
MKSNNETGGVMELPQSQAEPSKKQSTNKWRVLISVIFGSFMVILDTTVVNVAFQTLREEFGAPLDSAQWIISIYVLALGMSIPISAFLADRFGMKRAYLTGLFIFIIGSLLSGLSPSLGFMIFARAIQGIGGGIAFPLGAAALLRTFPVKEQGMALGYFGIAILTAPAIGPILGGFLVDQNVWRLIFFINPPIGLIGIILGLFFLPTFKSVKKPSLDILGLVTEIIGFGSVLYAASIAATDGWSAPDVLIWFGIGAVGLAAFAIIELFIAKEPLLDLRFFKKTIFLAATILGWVSVVALFGAEFLMPIYLQFLRGKSAFETGLILLPMAVTGALATTIAGRLYDRIGPRVLIVFGYSILMINTWQLSKLKADTSITFIMFLLSLRGLSLGSVIQTTFVTALSVVPLPRVAQGSSLINATRQVVQSFAVAIFATILASALSPKISALQQQIQNLPPQNGLQAVAICSTENGTSTGQSSSSPPPSSQVHPEFLPFLKQACDQNITGFEHAYRVTFYAATIALVIGLFFPGWPFKWAGRRAADHTPEL